LSTGDGTKTVYGWYKDAAGNVSSTASDSIVLDQTPPGNGTLSATAGNTQVTLNWSGFSDAGSGLATSNTYKLVFRTASLPNASCTNGTQILLGTATSFTHTGRTNGTTYYYRVCAFDTAGNTSTGATASATPQLGEATLLSPANGSTLPGATATFTWSAGTGVTYYHLYLGSTPGGTDVYNQGQGMNLSATISGLPTDGRPLYLRLWSLVLGSWAFNDYTFTDSQPAKATLLTPANGSTLPGASATFTWSAGSGVTYYHLYLGSTVGGSDLYNQGQGMNLAATVSGLPTDGRPLYLRLWSLVLGSWAFNDYTFLSRRLP
jgi:hypothetical protein